MPLPTAFKVGAFGVSFTSLSMSSIRNTRSDADSAVFTERFTLFSFLIG